MRILLLIIFTLLLSCSDNNTDNNSNSNGNRNSDSIDYNNNILDAVICIGIPVPPPSVFSDALKEFLETKSVWISHETSTANPFIIK